MLATCRSLLASCLVAFVASASAWGDDSLPVRIDRLIAAQADGRAVSPRVDDAGFVRRVYLDFAGRVPTSDEARAFLADKDPAKRDKLIDKLLAGAEYAPRMQDLFNAMLMERRGENADWAAFLRKSFEANKPWDAIAKEIIRPNQEDEATRGAAFFYTNRLDKVGQQETDFPGLTRDVGRLFLGMDLQCAQCHNHLFIDDYKQRDFQGLFTVYLNTYIRKDVKFPAVGENLMQKKLEFMSVFDKVSLATGPGLPGGREFDIPQFEKGQEYLVPPDTKKRTPGVPKFSPLETLARELPKADNQAFVENIVNRLWFVMLGRGIVHPLDQHHTANPPSHPELLHLLRDEFVAHKFDIKWLLGQLARTEAYQRSTELPSRIPAPPESFLVGLERRLSAEQLLASMLTTTGYKPEKLEELRAAFVKALANAAKEPEEEFSPSLKSALFVLNDGKVLDMLTAREGSLVERLSKLDEDKLADELYLTVLTRLPVEGERAEVRAYLASHSGDRKKAIGHLAWALLASTEFCLNH